MNDQSKNLGQGTDCSDENVDYGNLRKEQTANEEFNVLQLCSTTSNHYLLMNIFLGSSPNAIEKIQEVAKINASEPPSF